jgi:Zn-dependent protease
MIQPNQFFSIIVLLFSIVIHEVSHGWAALKLGDDTAEKMGRLTLNPIPHLDIFGSILLPLILIITHAGVIFGWAKPVPYNPLKLRKPGRDSALLALAGPAANFSLALVFGLLMRIGARSAFGLPFLSFLGIIVQINLILAIFNLLPIPPLDGSKILFYFFPSPKLEIFLYQYSFIILLVFIMFGWSLIYPLVALLFYLFTGFH